MHAPINGQMSNSPQIASSISILAYILAGPSESLCLLLIAWEDR